jgi:hypothetical protein
VPAQEPGLEAILLRHQLPHLQHHKLLNRLRLQHQHQSQHQLPQLPQVASSVIPMVCRVSVPNVYYPTNRNVLGATCSTDGAVVCNPDGTKFGLCDWGRVRFMAVAAGTQCKNGAIVRRNIWAKKD